MAYNNLTAVQEFLRIDEKLNYIRQQQRIRERENTELAHLNTKANKIITQIKHITSKIEAEKLFISTSFKIGITDVERLLTENQVTRPYFNEIEKSIVSAWYTKCHEDKIIATTLSNVLTNTTPTETSTLTTLIPNQLIVSIKQEKLSPLKALSINDPSYSQISLINITSDEDDDLLKDIDITEITKLSQKRKTEQQINVNSLSNNSPNTVVGEAQNEEPNEQKNQIEADFKKRKLNFD